MGGTMRSLKTEKTSLSSITMNVLQTNALMLLLLNKHILAVIIDQKQSPTLTTSNNNHNNHNRMYQNLSTEINNQQLLTAKMSSHHLDNITSEISSLEITPTRPRQEGKLALLPTEILLKILNDTEIIQKPVEQNPRLLHPLKNAGTIDVCTNVLTAPDVKNLALASSSLFHRLSPSFYLAGNYYAFRSAVKHADVDAMKRCAELGAAPDMHWELEEQVKSCSVPISKSIEALQWLLDNGYDTYEQRVSLVAERWPSSGVSQKEIQNARAKLKTVSMPDILMSALSVSAGDRDRTEGICQMISMLLGHGCLIPYNFNLDALTAYSNPNHVFTPMDVAMMSHCPPHFLEEVLELYKSHDVHVQRTADTCPETMSRWVGWYLDDEVVVPILYQHWSHKSHLGHLAHNLFGGLLDPAKAWKEGYHGETADVFEEKINLMKKYDFIDSSETQALQCILESLRCIARMKESAGGLDKVRDGKKCWEMIFDSLRPVAPALLRQDHLEPQRIHRFDFDNWRDPWGMYYYMQLQDKDILDEQSHAPWIRKGDLIKRTDGTVIDRKFGPILNSIIDPFSSTELHWVKYDYDGLMEMVAKEFNRYEKERQEWKAQKLVRQEKRQERALGQLRTLLVAPGEEEEKDGEDEDEDEDEKVVEEGEDDDDQLDEDFVFEDFSFY
ncbi:unnamed protein product [Fusarium graminearum]|nr:unnamed protein product [Fusarium graminearum]CZS77175.1 unnamed protein product [Fusarium graminearum]VTO87761.1 unnamed protein product [Fusarium graminearum]